MKAKAARGLLGIALALAFVVIGTSSGLRLAADGLGCQPWPRCYGRAAAPPALDASAGERAVRLAHRAAASGFALVALLAVGLGWRAWDRRARVAAALLLGSTVLLAAIGRFTPSGIPAVTLANVIGGLTLAGAAAFLLALPSHGGSRGPRRAGWLSALVLLAALLVASGATISVREAGAACDDGCTAAWPTEARALWHPLQRGTAAEVGRGARSGEALHGVHRLIAVLVIALAPAAVALAPQCRAGRRWLLGALGACVLSGWALVTLAGALAPAVVHALAAGALAAAFGTCLAAAPCRREVE